MVEKWVASSVTKHFRRRPHSTLDIRISLTDTSAITFLHSMILAHTGYRITNWSYTCLAAIGPIELCYKLALNLD